MLRKIRFGAVFAALAMVTVVQGGVSAYANKVDCTKVMSAVSAGKKGSEIAKDLNISTSSVYRCKKKAAGSKAAAKASPVTAAASPTPAVKASPSHK